jgi:hypothetical protein
MTGAYQGDVTMTEASGRKLRAPWAENVSVSPSAYPSPDARFLHTIPARDLQCETPAK